MLRFKVGSDYQGTLRALHDSIRELNGRLEYYSPRKGVIIFAKPWYGWYALLTMVIDIDQLPGGCMVTLKACFPGVPFRYKWVPRRYEAKFAERVRRNVR